MIGVLVVLALGGLMHAARSFSASGDGDAGGSAGTAISFGYLMLTAYFLGDLFKKVRLPRLTGYIATGIVVGPGVLGLVPEVALENLSLVSSIAVALIALSAGSELELRAIRPLARTIGWITLVAVGGTAALLTGVVFAARSLLPFMAAMPAAVALSVAFVLGVVMVAQSPAVVIALRDETGAVGPVASTVLGVVVLADLVVILLFAVATSVAKAMLGAGADVLGTAAMLAWEIFGSLVSGALIGAVLAVYLRRVKGGAPLFVLAVALVVAEVGRRLHLDPLLVALSAGLFVRNVTGEGDALHHQVEASALPVYVVFFAVAGATIHLDVLGVVGIPALLFVVVRGGGFLVGARIASRIAGAPESVARFAGFGLLPQAGLALALSTLFARSFPEFGLEAGALTLGIVAINEIVAPALYRSALVRSGEARALDPAGGGESAPEAPPASAH